MIWQALSAVATVVATASSLLQWRHRLADDTRFAEVHSRIDSTLAAGEDVSEQGGPGS